MSIIRKILNYLPYYNFPETNKQETKTKKKPKKSFEEVLSECNKTSNFIIKPFSDLIQKTDNTSVLDSYNDKHLF